MASQSLGEWSNPSDEERARQERLRLRMSSHVVPEAEAPRRLPQFPRPPSHDFTMSHLKPDDVVTNPSEDGLTQPQYQDQGGAYRSHNSPPVGRSRPLPLLPH